MKLRSPTSKPIILRPVHPNVGVQARYLRELLVIVREVHGEALALVQASYPRSLAQDAGPVGDIRFQFALLGKRWKDRMNREARAIAEGFASGALHAGDVALQAHLQAAGFSVKFHETPAVREALKKKITENVDLISSIPIQHLDEVEELVAGAIHSGTGLHQLTKDLQERFNVTRDRAELIARDQNSKACATIQKVRQKELGITRAIWRHSGASSQPREEHVEWDGTTYNVEDGKWSDVDGEQVWPGTACNCRCVALSVIPGLEDEQDIWQSGEDYDAA